jgi:crotonobetainyl-CoA:carnitine CoA-transferase CaiB-like acyl-CoA transferase
LDRDNSLLSGIRVIDLSTVLAGPYCTMILGDLGAEIIKIENPKGGALAGDFSRVPAQYHVGGIGAYFLAVNRNEKSVGLDLTEPEGREIFHDLVKVSDVVFDNSRPGVIEKLGADYETLRKIKPDIISCSLTGYGHTGPYSQMPAYDIVVQARGGTMGITGEPGRPPAKMGPAMGDLAGSLFAAIGICACLFNREKTGRSRRVDVSLLDCQVSLLAYLSEYYLVGGLVPGPQGSGHETLVPYRAYRAKDAYLVLACPNEKLWQCLLKALGREDLLQDPDINNAMARVMNKKKVDSVLEDILKEKTVAEWGKSLDEYGVPWAPINGIDIALSDPQILARNMVVDIEHPVVGHYKSVGNPVKVSDTIEEFEPAPLMGQNTREVLESVLHYDKDRIDELFEKGVVGVQTPEELEEISKAFQSLRDIYTKLNEERNP